MPEAPTVPPGVIPECIRQQPARADDQRVDRADRSGMSPAQPLHHPRQRQPHPPPPADRREAEAERHDQPQADDHEETYRVQRLVHGSTRRCQEDNDPHTVDGRRSSAER